MALTWRHNSDTYRRNAVKNTRTSVKFFFSFFSFFCFCFCCCCCCCCFGWFCHSLWTKHSNTCVNEGHAYISSHRSIHFYFGSVLFFFNHEKICFIPEIQGSFNTQGSKCNKRSHICDIGWRTEIVINQVIVINTESTLWIMSTNSWEKTPKKLFLGKKIIII